MFGMGAIDRNEVITNYVRDFFDHHLNARIEECKSSARALRNAREKKAIHHHETALKLVGIQEDIDTLRKQIERQEFAQDFDLLLRMEGIRGIWIEGQEIKIGTKRLFQKPSMTGPATYDIGQFLIKITVRNANDKKRPDRFDITFERGPYRGPFVHPHATAGNVCFGNNTDTGLNGPIDKHIQDLNMIDLVHLILSFLERDSIAPREISSSEKRTDTSCIYTANCERGYQNFEEREHNKRAYIQLIKNTLLERRTMLMDGAMQNALREEKDARESLASARANEQTQQILLEALFDQRGDMRPRAKSEADQLILLNEVTDIRKENDELRIYINREGERYVIALGDLALPRILELDRNHPYGAILDSKGHLIPAPKEYNNLIFFQTKQSIAELIKLIMEILKVQKIVIEEVGGPDETGV